MAVADQRRDTSRWVQGVEEGSRENTELGRVGTCSTKFNFAPRSTVLSLWSYTLGAVLS